MLHSGIPAIKEPSGLLGNDRRGSGGLALIMWLHSKPLTWDVAVSHTFLASDLSVSDVIILSGAAQPVVERKPLK
jgi:hypothetical protein